MARKIMLHPKDFKYPTKNEMIEVNKTSPDIAAFDFEYKSHVKSIIKDKKPFDVIHKENLLYQWNICLINKLGHLSFSYNYSLTHYNRGIPENYNHYLKRHYINSLQFNYYVEIFYYQFFSVRDIIGQIISVYYSLGVKENEVNFNKINISNLKAQTIINTFKEEIKPTSKLRNSFTHRFPPNIPDNRSILEDKDDHKSIGFFKNRCIKPKDFIDNMNVSLRLIENLIIALRNEFTNE